MQRSSQLAHELHENFKLLLCSSGSSACVKSCGPWQWQLKCPTCGLSGSRVLRGTALLWSRCACGLSVMLSGRSASKMIAPLLLSVSWSFQYLRNHTCGSGTIEHNPKSVLQAGSLYIHRIYVHIVDKNGPMETRAREAEKEAGKGRKDRQDSSKERQGEWKLLVLCVLHLPVALPWLPLS